MATTTTTRNGLIVIGDPSLVTPDVLREQGDANAAILDAAVLYDEGPIGLRPTSNQAVPGKAGRRYRSTDETPAMDYSDLGNGWEPGLPCGAVLPFAGATAPGGYLLCDGAPVSRTTYAALFVVIGTAYGVGDGSTTFGLPKLSGGAAPIGAGTSALGTNFARGASGGEEKHTLTAAEIPAHTHGISTASDLTQDAGFIGRIGAINQATVQTQANTGGGSAHNNMPLYQVVNYIIKAT